MRKVQTHYHFVKYNASAFYTYRVTTWDRPRESVIKSVFGRRSGKASYSAKKDRLYFREIVRRANVYHVKPSRFHPVITTPQKVVRSQNFVLGMVKEFAKDGV